MSRDTPLWWRPWPWLGLRLLFFTALATAGGESVAFRVGNINYSNVVPGLAYAHLRYSKIPLSIHIARLDRSHRELALVSTLAGQRVQGLKPLSQQVAALDRNYGRPLAAINGDFFELHSGPYQGDPGGLQILNGELVSGPGEKSFWIDRDGEPHLGLTRSRMEVNWTSGAKSRLGLNESPLTNAATLFTPTFGDYTRATNQIEIVLRHGDIGPWLPLQVDRIYRARIVAIRAAGNTRLETNLMVLTVNGTAATNIADLRTGDLLTLSTSNTANLTQAPAALGGGPILLHQGEVQPWPSQRGILNYLQPRHPRSALGFNARYLFLVVVDGRQAGLSAGMSFLELTSLLKQIGCTEAMNLDGGGSATFWLNGKVVNSPSDKRERGVANGLVIVQRNR